LINENLKWAVRGNAVDNKRAMGQVKSYFRDDNAGHYTVVWVHGKAVMDKTDRWQRLDYNDPLGGQNGIKNRVPKATDHWNNGGVMDPSEMGGIRNGAIGWTNGRHRIVSAIRQGYKWVPVIVPLEDIQELQTMMPVKFKRPYEKKKVIESVEVPTNFYGSWLNSRTGEILPVAPYAHQAVMLKYIRGLQKEHELDADDYAGNPALWAYNHGWVRLNHNDFDRTGKFISDNILGVEGKKSALKIGWKYLLPYLDQCAAVIIDYIKEHITTGLTGQLYADNKTIKKPEMSDNDLRRAILEGIDSKYKVHKKSWYNVIMGKEILMMPNEHHLGYLKNNVMEFLPSEKLPKISEESPNGDWASDEIIDLVFNAGWVRASYEQNVHRDILFLESKSSAWAVKAARHYLKVYPEIQNIQLETENGFWMLNGAEEVDRFVKRGILDKRNQQAVYVNEGLSYLFN
jgi:hypothetical protein